MTWYAHNLYLPATERALQVVRASQNLQRFLFLVSSLEDFVWHKPDVEHGLGPAGLAVVRPLGPTANNGGAWYAEPVLPWDSLHPVTSSRDLVAHVEEEEAPPVSLLHFIRELSAEVGAPVLYYVSVMWGGDIEFEASWVFTPAQHTYITELPAGKEPAVRCVDEHGTTLVESGDALRKGLAHLKIQLPTGFFALHTRSFPWEHYRVT